MKKIIIATLVLSLMLCFAACGSEPATNDNNAPAECWTYTHNGTAITMNADAAPVVTALGEPKTYTEETSCAFEGLDKTYFYGSFYIQTYPVGDKDYIFGVWFADDSVTTDEGVYVGMSQAEVESAYGAESFNGTNAYIMTKGKSTLTVILTDGAVTSIQYDAVVE